MKNTPAWLLLVTPFAVGCGIALYRALVTNSILAWCVFTACLVACLGILLFASFYVWYCGQTDGESRADVYFENWPTELDDLLSSKNDELRALAAAQLAVKAKQGKWRYRDDAIHILESIVTSPETSEKVIASAFGALTQFRPEVSAAVLKAAVEAVRASRNYNVLSAAMPLLARRSETRIDLKNIVASIGKDDLNVQYFGASALKWAREEAESPDEREGIEADIREIANRNVLVPSVKRILEG